MTLGITLMRQQTLSLRVKRYHSIKQVFCRLSQFSNYAGCRYTECRSAIQNRLGLKMQKIFSDPETRVAEELGVIHPLSLIHI